MASFYLIELNKALGSGLYVEEERKKKPTFFFAPPSLTSLSLSPSTLNLLPRRLASRSLSSLSHALPPFMRSSRVAVSASWPIGEEIRHPPSPSPLDLPLVDRRSSSSSIDERRQRLSLFSLSHTCPSSHQSTAPSSSGNSPCRSFRRRGLAPCRGAASRRNSARKDRRRRRSIDDDTSISNSSSGLPQALGPRRDPLQCCAWRWRRPEGVVMRWLRLHRRSRCEARRPNRRRR